MGPGTRTTPSPDASPPRLCVRLLGGVDLRYDGQPARPLGSAPAESLLAYLLLHRDRPQQRQRLAYLLWPDSTRSQARTNLRHVLHKLVRALPDADRFVDVGPQSLQWRPQAPWWLDVDDFEQALAEDRLADAVHSYTGDLLEGRDEDWLREERERLAQLHRDALERLVRRLGAQKRWTEAIRHAERLVRLDPLREQAHRLLIRLCDAAGERTRAVRAYHACEATLHRELGVEPAAATRATYEALLPVAEGSGPASPARAPLVGRAAERARLISLWRGAQRGGAHLALVTGEPGVGKSRLVEELRSWCAQGGAVTAEARAYPAEGTMAYGAAVAWLRSEPIAARLRRLDRAHLTELARLLPELLAEVPGLTAPEPLPDSEQRERLFRALARGVLSAGVPLLLVADDLQWCDVQTLRFVHYLLRTEPGARLLVAATARREEIDTTGPGHRFLAAVEALERLSEVRLTRLDRAQTALLGAHIAGRPLADAEADRLYGDSEGNPLFVVEAVHARPAAPGSDAATGSKANAVIAARLAQLSAPAAELVGVAATIGREFTAEVLAAACGADESVLVRGLDELWRRGLVRAFGPSGYDFSHGRIREVAYRALSPAQVRHHHLRVARALVDHGADRDTVSGQIAAHYDRAGSTTEAVTWFAAAADTARRLHADAEAVRALERALELAASLPASAENAHRELGLLTALPAPLIAVEGYLSPRVTEVQDRALQLAGRLGVEPAAPLVRSLALATLTRGDLEAARPFGLELRFRAERDGDDVLWVESAYVLGIAAFWQGRLAAARVEFEAAVARSRPEHRGAHLLRYGQDPAATCQMRLAYTLWLLGWEAEADRAREVAFELAERSEHPYTRWVAHTWSGLLAFAQRDPERLRHHLRALETADPSAQPAQVRLAVDAFAGLLDVGAGRAAAGLDRMRSVLAEVRSHPPAPGVGGAFLIMLLAAYETVGAAPAGLAAADDALAQRAGSRLWEPEIRRRRAGFLGALGAPAESVAAELGRALAVARGQGARTTEQRILQGLATLGATGAY